jgi:hypothetical protein
VAKYPIILIIPKIETKRRISAGGYAAFLPLKKKAILKMAQKNAMGMMIYRTISSAADIKNTFLTYQKYLPQRIRIMNI